MLKSFRMCFIMFFPPATKPVFLRHNNCKCWNIELPSSCFSKDRRPSLESQVSQTSELSREVKLVPRQAHCSYCSTGPPNWLWEVASCEKINLNKSTWQASSFSTKRCCLTNPLRSDSGGKNTRKKIYFWKKSLLLHDFRQFLVVIFSQSFYIGFSATNPHQKIIGIVSMLTVIFKR